MTESQEKLLGSIPDDPPFVAPVPYGRSGSSSCFQDRFKDWSVEDYEKEIQRVQAAHRHLEMVIPKLKRAAKRDAYKAFDFSI